MDVVQVDAVEKSTEERFVVEILLGLQKRNGPSLTSEETGTATRQRSNGMRWPEHDLTRMII